MYRHRSFRDVLNEPEMGLALIHVTAKNRGKELVAVTLRDSETLNERTVLLPITLSLREIKLQARALFLYAEASGSNGNDDDADDDDDEDEDDAVTTVHFPLDGVEEYDNDEASELLWVADEAAWARAKALWAARAPERRDALLLEYCREATRAIQLGGAAAEVLFAARRLSGIIGVAANQASLSRLAGWPVVFGAIVGLLQPSAGLSPSGGGVSSSHGAWVTAAGARLHWGLAQSNDRYRRAQACTAGEGGRDDAPTTLPLLRALRWATHALRRRRRLRDNGSDSTGDDDPEAWVEGCDGRALDAMAFLCLGAVVANLRDARARQRHGGEVAAHAVELAVHGGAADTASAAASTTPGSDPDAGGSNPAAPVAPGAAHGRVASSRQAAALSGASGRQRRPSPAPPPPLGSSALRTLAALAACFLVAS
jgi:hypothetical protein